MRLVKIGKIPGLMDISEQTVRKLVKDGVWKHGAHYYDNGALNFRLFDMDAISKWIKGDSDVESTKMSALAERMVW